MGAGLGPLRPSLCLGVTHPRSEVTGSGRSQLPAPAPAASAPILCTPGSLLSGSQNFTGACKEGWRKRVLTHCPAPKEGQEQREEAGTRKQSESLRLQSRGRVSQPQPSPAQPLGSCLPPLLFPPLDAASKAHLSRVAMLSQPPRCLWGPEHWEKHGRLVGRPRCMPVI